MRIYSIVLTLIAGLARMARFCGSGSLTRGEEGNLSPPRGRKSTRRHRRGGNPYAARGLEEFTTVVAELESRREKIMARAGDQGISAVRFRYSDSRDWVPIVVRHSKSPPQTPAVTGDGALRGGRDVARPKSGGGGWFYWAAVVVMILVSLAVSGRVVAICCTAGYWYFAPQKRWKEVGEKFACGMIDVLHSPRLEKKT